MKTVGIIVEYNPLHNGHLYHIEETRRLSKCDTLICVMSGNFTQRGEPAITDKFRRTRMALDNGVDLVIELPFVFTVQNADIFAYTSVSILNHLGVDEIYFGSENANISELSKLGEIITSNDFNSLVKKNMKAGDSYPTASDKAMNSLYPNSLFAMPNNILGIQYLLAGKKLKSPIVFHTIKRTSTNYYDEIIKGTTIQSASSIRKELILNKDISTFVPQSTLKYLDKTVTYNDFSDTFKYILNSTTAVDLKTVFSINEGFENKLLKERSFNTTEDLIQSLLSRRYTNSKIKRMLAHILCDTKNSLITSFEVPYIRILGMNTKGKNYLSLIKKELTIPLYSKVKEGLHPYLDHELKVSRIYSLAIKEDIFKKEIGKLIYPY